MTRWALLLLLVLAAATSVSAFGRAKITSQVTIPIVNTAGALLSVDRCASCAANDTAVAAYSGNSLLLNFTKGATANTYGFQPAGNNLTTTYLYRDLIVITNRVNRTISVTVLSNAPDSISLVDTAGNPVSWPVTLAAGASLTLSVKWQIGVGAATGSKSLQLTVRGV